MTTTISVKAFINTVKAWKELTSTSPSGQHLDQYHAAILEPDLAWVNTDLLNIPITYGFAPGEWWTHSVTPLIEKGPPGLPYLTRLCVIHLLEANYNLFLKLIFDRRMINNAELAEALNDQQHGSRPRRMTTDPLFLARLKNDLTRQTRANSAQIDNDATGCNDRIVPSLLGMIARRRLGMPTNAIVYHADALQNMRYAVKQAAGIYMTEYTVTIIAPLYGTG